MMKKMVLERQLRGSCASPGGIGAFGHRVTISPRSASRKRRSPPRPSSRKRDSQARTPLAGRDSGVREIGHLRERARRGPGGSCALRGGASSVGAAGESNGREQQPQVLRRGAGRRSNGQYYCVIVCAQHRGSSPHAEAAGHGESWTRPGPNGFGFDPYFCCRRWAHRAELLRREERDQPRGAQWRNSGAIARNGE